MIYSLFIIGLISILGQVVLLREINVALYGIELVYMLAIGFWLFGTAIGALLGVKNSKPLQNGVPWLLAAFALLLPLEIAFTRGIRVFFGGIPGAYLSFSAQMAGVLIAIIPLAVLSGMLFRWAAVAYLKDEKRTLAGAYAIESLGGVIGGLLSTAFLYFGLSNLFIGLICSFTAVLSACLLLISFHRMKTVCGGFTIVSTLAIIALIWFAYPLDRLTTEWNHPHLFESMDTPYGRITVEAWKGQISVFENDALSFESQGTSSEELAHFSALSHSRPGSILVLGGGCEGIVRDLLQHNPRQIDYIELDDVLIEEILPVLPKDIQYSLNDSRVRKYFGDPRSLLRRLDCYDVIIVGMPEPSSGQSNRFYTREFFELAKKHLRSGGILALRLRSAENLWPEALTRRNVSVVQALRQVFRDALVLPGTVNIILASDTMLMRDPEKLMIHCDSLEIRSRIVNPPYINYILTNDRLKEIAAYMAMAEAPINSDEHPVCYFYTSSVWLSKLFPSLIRYKYDGQAQRNSRWLIVSVCICFLIILTVIFLAKPPGGAVFIAGIAGFYGMLMEMILLLRFQSANGVLYRDIGLLLTLFMLGLAVGSAWMDRRRNAALRTFGIGILLGACLVGAIVALPPHFLGTASPIWIAFLLFATGFFVSAAFAWTAYVRMKTQQENVAPLYAADLIGGCLGSWAGSLWLMPVYGLTATAVIGIFFIGLSVILTLRISR